MGPKGRGGGGGREPELAPKAVWLPLPRSFEVALLGKYHRGHREKSAFGSLLSCREESLTWKYGCVIFFFFPGGDPCFAWFQKGRHEDFGGPNTRHTQKHTSLRRNPSYALAGCSRANEQVLPQRGAGATRGFSCTSQLEFLCNTCSFQLNGNHVNMRD